MVVRVRRRHPLSRWLRRERRVVDVRYRRRLGRIRPRPETRSLWISGCIYCADPASPPLRRCPRPSSMCCAGWSSAAGRYPGTRLVGRSPLPGRSLPSMPSSTGSSLAGEPDEKNARSIASALDEMLDRDQYIVKRSSFNVNLRTPVEAFEQLAELVPPELEKIHRRELKAAVRKYPSLALVHCLPSMISPAPRSPLPSSSWRSAPAPPPSTGPPIKV